MKSLLISVVNPFLFFLFFFAIIIAPTVTLAGDLNLHLIDSDSSGYAIYRMGKPEQMDLRAICQLGIKEMMVLSGTAQENEVKYAKECPSLKVIYNLKQSVDVPLSKEFLDLFDHWVEVAKVNGTKIAFRCECGCHRTGRLAAYYNMKYLGWDVDHALEDMANMGKHMGFFKNLIPQVRDLRDYVDGLPCRQDEPYCVVR